MGNDLYWKQTPKPVTEEHHGISMHSWHMLAEIFKKDDFEDLAGYEFDTTDLKDFVLMHDTAKACGDAEFAADIHDGRYQEVRVDNFCNKRMKIVVASWVFRGDRYFRWRIVVDEPVNKIFTLIEPEGFRKHGEIKRHEMDQKYLRFDEVKDFEIHE